MATRYYVKVHYKDKQGQTHFRTFANSGTEDIGRKKAERFARALQKRGYTDIGYESGSIYS